MSSVRTPLDLRSFSSSRSRCATFIEAAKPGRSKIESVKYDDTVWRRLPKFSSGALQAARSWITLVEPCLPFHLNERNGASIHDTSIEVPSDFKPDAEDVAELLLAAQRRDIDVIHSLAVEQGRWAATVWLVKHLVDHFGADVGKPESLPLMHLPWPVDGMLDELTRNAIDLETSAYEDVDRARDTPSSFSLSALTADQDPNTISRHDSIRHKILGLVWRSLGAMTMSCAVEADRAQGVMKPEVLEIIACLHHHGWMPASIYNYVPSPDENPLQQPPMLHLLSSYIMTALSDAAWRGHERQVVEEAKAKGAEYASLRSEIPGAAYRVKVASLKPELWLELILWSCLHGGWIEDGAAILAKMCDRKTDRRWKPTAWRNQLRSSLPFGKSHLLDWDQLKYFFETRPVSTMVVDEAASINLNRTVSAEVVNAYIDALLNMVGTGVGDRGVAIGRIIDQLNMFRTFLEQAELTLGAGSWDAVILRLVESGGLNIEQRPTLVRSLANLAPWIGKEARAKNTQSLPSYVLGGSAATIGLLHRALRAQIAAEDVQGAIRTFTAIQERTDLDKHRSMVDFFAAEKDSVEVPMSGSMFNHNFAGIDYPAFDSQIPSTVLGPFLDLVTEQKYYEIGHWLLYSKDVDGPAIPERLYYDAAITSALVRYATATNDRVLLQRVLQAKPADQRPDGPRLPRNVLQSFLDSQLGLKRWDASTRILEYMRDTKGFHWNIFNLATLIRVMLQLALNSKSGDAVAKTELDRSKAIFANIVCGKYDDRVREDVVTARVTSLLAVLGSVSNEWAVFCSELLEPRRHFKFALSPRTFNLVLDAVVEAYGSVAGRRLIGLFWPHAIRERPFGKNTSTAQNEGVPKMPRFEPDALDDIDRVRTIISMPGVGDVELVMYGGLQPDAATIATVLRKAVDEYKAGPDRNQFGDEDSLKETPDNQRLESRYEVSPDGMVVWAVRRLRELGMEDTDISVKLQKELGESGSPGLKEQLRALFRLDHEETTMSSEVQSAT